MKPKYRGVIFDLDGTLVDTLKDIGASMNRALKTRGFPELEADDYKSKVGWGIKRLAFLAMPEDIRSEESAGALAADASNFYAENPLSLSKVYGGINELLAALNQMKIKCAVLTNKPDTVARRVIAGLFPPGIFCAVRGEISGSPRKPDPASVWDILVEMDLNPSDVIFAGDSEIDIETALAAGCFPLGVSWGYRSRETVGKAGARRIIDKPEELLELL